MILETYLNKNVSARESGGRFRALITRKHKGQFPRAEFINDVADNNARESQSLDRQWK
jgi:hypothetical protein